MCFVDRPFVRLGVDTGAAEERLASIRRMLSVGLQAKKPQSVSRVEVICSISLQWFLSMTVQHSCSWRIADSSQMVHLEAPRLFRHWAGKIFGFWTKVRVAWDQTVCFCMLPLRVSLAGMSSWSLFSLTMQRDRSYLQWLLVPQDDSRGKGGSPS